MRAAVYSEYGDYSQLTIKELPAPVPKANEVLLDVYATSINGSDYEFLTGRPAYARINGFKKPKKPVLGSDISGVIAQVGSDVSRFKIGDEVFCDNFEYFGGFAEQVCVADKRLVLKPKDVSHEIACSIPQSGVIALQGLRKYGEVKAGQRVLINGAGGSAGCFAIQMAKRAGAQVTAVDHGNKASFMRSQGADVVIDYTSEDVTKTSGRFDKILDLVGQHPLSDYRGIMSDDGVYTIVGGPLKDILGALILGGLGSLISKKKMGLLMHQQNESDMKAVLKKIQKGHLKSCIGGVFALDDIQEAFKQFGAKKTIGKVVIKIRD
jgi:NADPH:quinone reductase-like Zn-dependent oxidoreductase